MNGNSILLGRYIRICFLCQLRELGAFTEKNAWMYKLGIVLFSVLFYIPKFFEVRWESTDVSFNTTHMCAEVIMRSLGGGGGGGGGGGNSTVLTTFFRFFAPPSPTNGTTTAEEGDPTEDAQDDIEALLVIDLVSFVCWRRVINYPKKVDERLDLLNFLWLSGELFYFGISFPPPLSTCS